MLQHECILYDAVVSEEYSKESDLLKKICKFKTYKNTTLKKT